MKEVSPPVGVYNDPRCALELLRRTTGVKKSPFGITAVRFTPNHKKYSAPGQYVCGRVCAPNYALLMLDTDQSDIPV